MAITLVRFFTGGRIVRRDVTNGIPPDALGDYLDPVTEPKEPPKRASRARAPFRMPDGMCDINEIARLCNRSVDIIYVWRGRDKSFPKPVQGGGKGGRKARLLWDLEVVRKWAKTREARAKRSGRR